MQVKSLGYAVIQSTDLTKWESYADDVVGLMRSTSMPDNGTLYLKMDERPFRYAIQKGDVDGLLCAGWEVADEAAFDAAQQELTEAGVEFVKVEDATLLAARAVSGLLQLADPSGNKLEIYWANAQLADDGIAFVSPQDVKAFINKDKNGETMGLGHVVLHAPTDFEGTHDFYVSLGLADSDITDMSGVGMGKIYFMHCNARHHSLALWSWGAPCPETDFMPSPESKAPGCVHMMMEVGSLAEVGSCLDRVNAKGLKVTSTLGEHINDEMISFYMLSPGNFAMEFGFDGVQLDSNWKTTHNVAPSKWGHQWSG